MVRRTKKGWKANFCNYLLLLSHLLQLLCHPKGMVSTFIVTSDLRIYCKRSVVFTKLSYVGLKQSKLLAFSYFWLFIYLKYSWQSRIHLCNETNKLPAIVTNATYTIFATLKPSCPVLMGLSKYLPLTLYFANILLIDVVVNPNDK